MTRTKVLLTLLALVAVIVIAFQVSPYPSSWVIRTAFDSEGTKVAKKLDDQAPQGTETDKGIQYAGGTHLEDGRYTTLDIVRTTAQKNEKLPVIIWTHGGGWVSGDSDQVNPYLKYLVNNQVAAVSLNYTLAPDGKYPTQPEQVNQALSFLKNNADKYNLDMSKVVMAGDSAGAQLTSQIAALTTNAGYAQEMSITPALQPGELKGLVLNCGIYDMGKLMSSNSGSGLINWGLAHDAWAITGAKNASKNSNDFTTMSAINYVTPQYPPVLISGGNGDALTETQSKPFADKLKGLGVNVTTEFFDNANPKLPHEYQFKMEFKESIVMLNETKTWVNARLA